MIKLIVNFHCSTALILRSNFPNSEIWCLRPCICKYSQTCQFYSGVALLHIIQKYNKSLVWGWVSYRVSVSCRNV